MIVTILLIILVLALLGSFTRTTEWGYGPSGGIGFILIILLVLVLLGYRF